MTREERAKIIYEELCYMYCDNCRYNSEIGEDDPNFGCDDCHRKYNGWGISMAEAERIAEMISSDTEQKDRPKGEWTDIGGVIRWGCSLCHYAYDQKFNFCPNCGSDNRGENNYERAIEQMEHDTLYESTYNPEDGSM